MSAKKTDEIREPWLIPDWEGLRLYDLRVQKMKWKMKHPYATKFNGDLSIDIEVEVEGETRKGVPHGLCFINFLYNGEL